MFERFTDRARHVVIMAQEEARRLSHNSIRPEHLLLGILHDHETVAYRALHAAGATLDGTRQRVVAATGQDVPAPAGYIPFTTAAKKALENGLREALRLGHSWIAAEHLLLGLLHNEETAQVVADMAGVECAAVRQHVMDLLSGELRVSEEDRRSRRVQEVAGLLAGLARLSLPVGDLDALVAALGRELGVVAPEVETAL